MPEETREDRTEPATPFRRNEARKKGKVARSAEVGRTIVFVGGLLLLWATGPGILDGLSGLFRNMLGKLARPDLNCSSASQLFGEVCLRALVPLVPALAGMAAIAALAGYAQVGFFVTTEPMLPRPDKFDPAAGFRRLFSLSSTATLAGSLLKIAAILVVGCVVLRSHLPRLVVLHSATTSGIARTIAHTTFDLCFKVGLALLVIAAMDYAFRRWEYERDLRMTKQEVKDENKMIEGNPEIQARIRRVQMALARSRMLADVKKADVVVRNPTHYAVALRYDPEKAPAPVVLAKGADHLAQRIIELARKYRVPTVREPPLAQALYKSVDVGEMIPPKLYRAVAKILVQIYRISGRKPPKTK